MELGKDPGMGVRSLHAQGITGRDLKAETRPMKAGLLGKRVTGFVWKGGRLAGIFSADSDLINQLSNIVIIPHGEEIR